MAEADVEGRACIESIAGDAFLSRPDGGVDGGEGGFAGCVVGAVAEGCCGAISVGASAAVLLVSVESMVLLVW